MQGPPLRLAPIGQGPLGRVQPREDENENEEVWTVPLNLFNRPTPGNRETLSNQRNVSWANKPPTTPRNQPIRVQTPKRPKKHTGSRRRKARKSTRRNRNYY